MMPGWLKLKKNNFVNSKYKEIMKIFWSNSKSEDIIKVLFLSKRLSKLALELKYYEKNGRNPKKLGENISSSFTITLNDGNHKKKLSQMFYKKGFPKNLAIEAGVLESLFNNVTGLKVCKLIKRDFNTGVVLWILQNF